MTIHRAAPQPERIVRAPGPDDQQRAAISSAEAGNHPTGWKPEPAGYARLLSCPRGPGLFRKPCQPFFARHTAAQYHTTWCRTRAVQAAMGGAPEFSP
jgi:hypothetical protein